MSWKSKIVLRPLLAFAFIAAIIIAFVTLSSCNVTRVITNESKYYQRGDTSVVIQTKVTETYDATKR